MELFIPSLLVIVLAALVCFILLPKMTPYTIGLLSVALFAIGIWQNYKMFPYEYKSSMVLSVLKEHASFVMLLAVILGGMVIVMMIYGKSPPSIAAVIPEIIPAAILPVAMLPTNTNATRTNTNNATRSNTNNATRSNSNSNTNIQRQANTNNATRSNTIKTNNIQRGNNIASTSFRVV